MSVGLNDVGQFRIERANGGKRRMAGGGELTLAGGREAA